jgi:hypothetical protein
VKFPARVRTEIPNPKTQVTTERYALRPNLSAVHPSDHMETIDAAAPAKSATPSGPGERPMDRLRSANSTAEQPAQSPKAPKAEAASASSLPRSGGRPRVQVPSSEALRS